MKTNEKQNITVNERLVSEREMRQTFVNLGKALGKNINHADTDAEIRFHQEQSDRGVKHIFTTDSFVFCISVRIKGKKGGCHASI